MSARFNPPSQEEFEARLRDCFKNGDITSVSSLTGQHRTSLSRQLNPEEPERSSLYETAVLLEGCRATRAELFEDVVGVLLSFIESRRPRPSQPAELSVPSLTQVINSYCERAPITNQLADVRRAIAMLRERETWLVSKEFEDSPEELTGKVEAVGRAR
jgi:hypothetical protein